MAYIGAGLDDDLEKAKTISMACDTMTGNGVLSTMIITSSKAPATVNNVSVYFDGVAQRPTTDYVVTGNTVTFITAPENNVKVICISYVDEYRGHLCDNSVTADNIEDSCITDSMIVGMSSSKLTGALPAGDGTALTNIASAVLQASTDPLITTNPAGGAGTPYMNSASGEMFICTDATTDNNVWTNVGGGSGDIAPWQIGRTVAGFVAGGYTNSNPSVIVAIDRFSFTADGNATDHGDLTGGNDGDRMGHGASSDTHAYVMGTKQGGDTDKVTKFAMSGTGVSATDHGTLRQTVQAGSSNHSDTHGYYSGGEAVSQSTRIDQIAFAGDGVSAVGHGDLRRSTRHHGGTGTKTHGYAASGVNYNNSPQCYTTVDVFPYATASGTAGHCDIAQKRHTVASNSSDTHGYASGGWLEPSDGGVTTNIIDKFSFASTAAGTDVGDLIETSYAAAGSSSTTHGYHAAGDGWPAGTSSGSRVMTNMIAKFSFASDGNATDVGA